MSSFEWHWVDILQLLGAALLGFIIGYQRELHYKPAGITTMTIVTSTSTLLMQLSIRFSALGEGPAGADPMRLAAAVITGIGFLGAGVIMQTGRQVHGITTAATIWTMTAAGLAIGAGFYIPCLTLVGLTWLSLAIDPLTVRFVKWRRMRDGQAEEPDEQP